jgi:hypothetical protein
MNKRPIIPVSYFIAIGASGLGVGLLVGLSASPVVNALLAGILSLAAGVVGALCGVRLEQSKSDATLDENPSNDQDKDQGPRLEWTGSPFVARVSPVPMAFLVVAIVAGSLAGIYARTHEWFAESPEHLVKKWQKSTDLSPNDIARRLFDSIYGTAKVEAKSEEQKNVDALSKVVGALVKLGEAKTNESNPVHSGILFAVEAKECKRLRSLDVNDLRLELQALGPNIKDFALRCKSDEDIKLALDLLICPEAHTP